MADGAVPLVFEPQRAALFSFALTPSGDVERASLGVDRLAVGGASSRGAVDVVVPPGDRRAATGTFIDLASGISDLAAISAAALPDLAPSVAAWSLASKLALDLVARERVVPWTDGKEARWAIALGPDDASNVAALARAFPRAAHAVCTTSSKKNEVWDPEALVRAFLDAAADALVRRACSWCSS